MRRIMKGPIVLPSIFVVVLLGFLIYGYIKTLNMTITRQYAQIEFQLKRTSNILAELDYSFNNVVYQNTALMRKQDLSLHDGVCVIHPTKRSLAAEKNIVDHTMVAIKDTYMVVGDPSLCTVNSALYQRVESRIALAPILRLSRSIDIFVYGVHYADLSGFMISSPPDIAGVVDRHVIDKLKDPEWVMYKGINPGKISLRGPMTIEQLNADKPLLFMLMPVKSNSLNGVIALDIDTEILFNCDYTTACNIQMQNMLGHETLPENAYRPHPLEIDGFDSDHQLYYVVDWSNEIVSFVKSNQDTLLVLFVVYIIFMAALFFIDMKKKHSYYKQLADYDPLTNLYNRRGFESFWMSAMHRDYIALAIFDVDDFKRINDTFGHDVGDRVIKYIGKTLQSRIRDYDAAARFGGEEFVVYIGGNNSSDLKDSLERVRQAICAGSSLIIESGFTVSGGAVVIQSTDVESFNSVFKSADQKLYDAKGSGKNKLVI